MQEPSAATLFDRLTINGGYYDGWTVRLCAEFNNMPPFLLLERPVGDRYDTRHPNEIGGFDDPNMTPEKYLRKARKDYKAQAKAEGWQKAEAGWQTLWIAPAIDIVRIPALFDRTLPIRTLAPDCGSLALINELPAQDHRLSEQNETVQHFLGNPNRYEAFPMVRSVMITSGDFAGCSLRLLSPMWSEKPVLLMLPEISDEDIEAPDFEDEGVAIDTFTVGKVLRAEDFPAELQDLMGLRLDVYTLGIPDFIKIDVTGLDEALAADAVLAPRPALLAARANAGNADDAEAAAASPAAEPARRNNPSQ